MAGQDHPYEYDYVGIVPAPRPGTGLVWVLFEVDGHPGPLVAQLSLNDAKRLREDLRGAIGEADPTPK